MIHDTFYQMNMHPDLTDPDKLRVLARWFDKQYPNEPSEVQDDLRRIATNLELKTEYIYSLPANRNEKPC